MTDIANQSGAATAGSYEMVDFLQKARYLTSGSKEASMDSDNCSSRKAILDTTSVAEPGNVSGIEQARGSK